MNVDSINQTFTKEESRCFRGDQHGPCLGDDSTTSALGDSIGLRRVTSRLAVFDSGFKEEFLQFVGGKLTICSQTLDSGPQLRQHPIAMGLDTGWESLSVLEEKASREIGGVIDS